jgi:biofilm PGA synthesis N-glycosyltransferase PgaC
MSLPVYVLITPARNEAEYIESTIQSIVAQTVRPAKWVIVSDGSTDATDEIVSKYSHDHPWIELVRMPVRRERHFAGKVHAFNAGYARVTDIAYDVMGNIDADVSFDADHFEYLLTQLAANPRLGLAGAAFVENGERYDYRYANIEDVWGGCQLFRKSCYEDIGGYVPIKGGAIDHIAVVTARMKGWTTRTFTGKVSVHHRKMGTEGHSRLMAHFRAGVKDFSVGNHPLWELSRSLFRMRQSPVVLGGFMLLGGYMWSAISRRERPVPAAVIVFRRDEQMRRFREIVSSLLRISGTKIQAGKT